MTQVNLPDELGERVAAEAERQGISADELAARVLSEHVPARRHLSFTGIGASGRSDLSERYKEIRREEFGDKASDEV